MKKRSLRPLAGLAAVLSLGALWARAGRTDDARATPPFFGAQRDRTLPLMLTAPLPVGGSPAVQGLRVAASPRWRPADWPTVLKARSSGQPVTAVLPGHASLEPSATAAPVGLLLQADVSGSTAKVARLDSSYQPLAWTSISEQGYRVVSANLLDDGTGRVLWYKTIGSMTHVRLWHTDASFVKTDVAELDIGAEWVPFAHSQKYAAGLGYMGFRRVAAGAASNETFFWLLGWSGGRPDQVVGGTWIAQQGGGAWIPTGFALVGRGGRLLFSNPTTGCDEAPSDCRLAYQFWIVDDHVQMVGTYGYESRDTKLWDYYHQRFTSDWSAVSPSDDEIFFVNGSTREARLRFFDRLNLVALERSYTPDPGFQFIGYTRTAVVHHVPDATQQAMLADLLHRGCNTTNLFTIELGQPDSPLFLDQAALLARSNCAAFFLELPPWGKLPEFGPAVQKKNAIEAAAGRPLQFSFYLSEVVNATLLHVCYPDGACFNFKEMCWLDASGQPFFPYGGNELCAPDLRKAPYWSYVEHTFQLALDNGFRNFIFGPLWFQDMRSWSYADTVKTARGDVGIVTRVNRLRAIAAGRHIPVIIGGAYDGLSLESETVFDYAWHITNTPFQLPDDKGYVKLYDDRPCHPVSPGPYCPAIPWHFKYTSVVPTVSLQDVGTELTYFAGFGYGGGATAAERERERACLLQNIVDTHRRASPDRTGFLPTMVGLHNPGARGYDAYRDAVDNPNLAHARDFPIVNCFGPTDHEYVYSASNDYSHANACHDEDVINRLLRGEAGGVDCSTPIPFPVRAAEFTRLEVPPRMIAGLLYRPGAVYRNLGSVLWSDYYPVKPRLGAIGCPAGGGAWGCGDQPLVQPVQPAEARTLLAAVTAPVGPGSYPLQLQLFDLARRDWFGPPTPALTVDVAPPDPQHEAQFVSQKVPLRMHANGTYTVPITFRNLGAVPWDHIGPNCQDFHVGAIPTGPEWTPSRKALLPHPVLPGEEVPIALHVTAPSIPGTYDFQWRMLKECAFEFGDWTPLTRIEVIP